MKKLALLSLIPLSACATIFQGEEQYVNLSTASGIGAECEISTDENSEMASIPAEVKLSRSYYPILIDCLGDNGLRGSAQVYSDVSNWGYGGAVLGVGVGAGVDTYTGASFEYPQDIIIELGTHKVLGRTTLNSNVIDANQAK